MLTLIWGGRPPQTGYFLLVPRRARVRAALRAAAEREADERERAALRACLASDFREAARCGSRFKAFRTARARVRDGFRFLPV